MSSATCSRNGRGITHSTQCAFSTTSWSRIVEPSTATRVMSPPSAVTSPRSSSSAGAIVDSSMPGTLRCCSQPRPDEHEDHHAPPARRRRHLPRHPPAGADASRRRGVRACGAASADAGFASFSLWSFWATTYGTERTRALLDSVGIRVRAVEAVTQWVGGPSHALDAEITATSRGGDRARSRHLARVHAGASADITRRRRGGVPLALRPGCDQ